MPVYSDPSPQRTTYTNQGIADLLQHRGFETAGLLRQCCPCVGTLFRIAVRNVARNRRRTLITLAALFVGVGVLVSMRGLLNGLQRALVTNVADGNTGTIQVHRAGYMKNVVSAPLSLDFPAEEVMARIRDVPGVTAVAGRIMFAGMVSAGDDT